MTELAINTKNKQINGALDHISNMAQDIGDINLSKAIQRLKLLNEKSLNLQAMSALTAIRDVYCAE